MRKNFYLKKGATLIETIIAITILTIVSVMAVTVCVSSINAEERTLRDMEIASISSTAVDCFRFSDTEEELLSFLQQAEADFVLVDTISKFIKLEKIGYTLTLIFDTDFSILTVEAIDNSNRQIFNLVYTK